MNNPKLIVALGASAGGLEALESFFKHLPNDTGMAFVVVVHLDPEHVSLLPELLQRLTKMKVVAIKDGMKIQPNSVYVIPPKHNLSLLNSQFQLFNFPQPRTSYLPIDYFFRALAQDQGSHAVAIVLSGTGSDGSQGVKAIKAENGMVMVQDEASAKYDGMPHNAKATGLADFVLSPDKMPDKLIQYTQHRPNLFLSNKDMAINLNDSLQKILILIRNQTGHDFSLYKTNTIFRRIERRMSVHQINDILEYLQFLQNNEREINTLFKELLIGVTSFFRDTEAFKILRTQVLPDYIKDKSDDYTIRIWVPGCSTGEEAYSIAICMQECLSAAKRDMKVQVFGTDIDDEAIEMARSGLYSTAIIDEIGEGYCKRYFTKENGQYRIKKSVRETLVFATQNLIKDPPFTKLDLICCRNLLIYFSQELQKKVFPVFHYSLNEGGILFLGSSETTGHSDQYFTNIDKKWKIFKRKSHQGTEMTQLAMTGSSSFLNDNTDENKPLSSPYTKNHPMLQIVEAVLRQSSAASCVVIDSEKNIIYVHGRLGRYLDPAEGYLSSNLLQMARTEQLRNELTNCLRKATISKKKVQKKAIALQTDGEKSSLDLSVIPLQDIAYFENLLMVVFEQTPELAQVEPDKLSVTCSTDQDTVKLQQELKTTRDNLHTTIEDLETSNEELKSSNEELQSTNEELQSTNEELETSKEELQSLNEESTTVNAELQSRIDELSQTNDDIKNLLNSTQIATLFLDTELKIRRFTPKMTDIISLMPTDINRSISHFSSCLEEIKLTEHASQVLKTLDKIELEVNDDKGRFYKMRVLPYRTSNNVIDGVVISFEDVTQLKSIENSLRSNEQRYKSLFDNCPVAVLEINNSELVRYIESNHIDNVDDLEQHLNHKTIENKQPSTLIQVLNINEAGIQLFKNEPGNKERFLPQISQILSNHHDYLAHLVNLITEQTESVIFTTSIAIDKKPKEKLNFSCTLTIPKVNNKFNFNNSIFVIVKTNF